MFLPWSLFGRDSRKSRPTRETKPAPAQRVGKSRRNRLRLEELEDRTLLATFHVDISYTGALQTGSIVNPFRTIQQGVNAANMNAGADEIIVYGNNTGDPSHVYVWDRDGDADGNLIPDGNMLLNDGGVAGNTVSIIFRSQDRNGVAAPLVVKMLNNIIDVGNGCQLRVEGSQTFPVIFTSLPDDAAGGDTNGDGNINAPNRADWGGIRFRAGAVDEGLNNPNIGSIINWADIRYTGQTIFDPVVGDQTEFAGVRMEGDTDPTLSTDDQRAQIRIWNTIFRNGGRAIDVHIWALAGRGPDLGFNATGAAGLGAQPLTFINNSINGAFINIPFITDPFDPRFGQVIQLDQNAQLDDVGVPYVLTQRFVLANNVDLTIDPAIIIKSQRVTIDGVDAADVTDSTSGRIFVNGLVERPVLFTALADDNVFLPDTRLAEFYSNGSADTNNDGSLTSAAPGDWGGIRISQGHIDYAVVRFGGGLYPLQGTFVNTSAITVFAQDKTGIGGINEQVRIANSDISRTFTGTEFGNFYESAAIEIFSRDWNPFIQRTGDIAIIDNYIHDNQGKSILAHPMAFHDRRNPYGGYGVHFRRNDIERNENNGVYIRFILDLARGVDQNISRVGGYYDDTDIVHALEGQMLLVHQDQAFQMMSRRGVQPSIANGSFLDRFTTLTGFQQGLTLQLPGIQAIPLELGPNVLNPSLVDSGLYFNLVDFESTARGLNLAATSQNTPGTLYGTEWRDWGVNFTTGANQQLLPFYVRGNFGADNDPSGPPASGNNFLAVDNVGGNGSMDITFPNAVSAVGFWIVDNETTSPNERIEFLGVDGSLIESIALPTTTGAPNNRAFVGRISRQPIWRVRIIEDANDVTINNASATVQSSFLPITIPDNGSSVFGSAFVNFAGNLTISDLNVNVNITHPRASDLRVQLIAPDGTRIDLANRVPSAGVAGANFTNTYFDDQAAVPIGLGVAPFSGQFRPTQSLAAFNGKLANGTWQIEVTDLQGGPTGTARLENFSLTFAGTGPNARPDAIGIDDLYFVNAGEDLVIKAMTPNTVITAGAVQNGYRQVVQNGAGVITDGIGHDGFPITIVGAGTSATGFGHGGTLRILGQPTNPVVLTSINDNTVGSGAIGMFQNLTGNNPGATTSPGDWTGIQILPGSNNSKSIVVTQQPNGSINTRYADVNPYTLGDEPDTYFAGAQSYRERVLTAGLVDLIPNSTETRIMMQDGSLIEHANIRFAFVGIENVGYPETKLQIESNELEVNRSAPDDSANDSLKQPLLHWITRDDGTWVMNTPSGAHRVGARMGGLSENPFTGTDDVDWWEMPEPPLGGQQLPMYIDIQTGDPNLDRNFNIFAFNESFQMIYVSGPSILAAPALIIDQNGNVLAGGAATAAIQNSGGALGAVSVINGDFNHTIDNPIYDVKYIAIAPAGRFPRQFVPTGASPAGLLADNTQIVLFELPNSGPPGSNGFQVGFLLPAGGEPTDIPSADSVWNPEPGLQGAFLGGYEVEFRSEGFDNRAQRPVRLAEGEFVFRNNLINNAQVAAIRVTDFRDDEPSNLNAGEDVATQTVRFAQDNANTVTNTNGVVFLNNDYFLPGAQIYNNLIINTAGNAVVLTENGPAETEPPANLYTPTMFASVYNNTIDETGGAGVIYTGRGGANIINNIISNATVGIQFVKTPNIEPLRPTIQPVVSYNMLWQNDTHISANGSINATQNLLNTDPRFIDRLNLDYRLFVASPGVDSAISNISDRLSATRFPQEPLRAPAADYRGRARVDNPTRPNVGTGQFPFYDRGAFEVTEPPLRVIGLNVVSANQILGQPVSQLVIRFYGRVDRSTFTTSGSTATVRVNQDSATGPLVGLGTVTDSFDPINNIHTFTVQLQQTLISGVYCVTLKGTSSGTSDPGIRDISGNLLDGEFPAPYAFPSGNGISGGTFFYCFAVRTASVSGLVFNDANGNGLVNPGELGIGSVGVQLTWAGPDGVFGTGDDGATVQIPTSPTGNYSFTGLAPGNYRLNVNPATLPASFFLTNPPLPRTFTLSFGQDLTGQNLGYWQDFSNASLGNLVWNDLNGDGTRQAGEPALAGLVVNALWAGRDRTFGTADDQTFTTSTTFVDSGNFLFNANLPAGEYRVSVDPATLPPGFLRTTQLGVGEYPVEVLLTPGSSFLGIQIGFQQKNSSIGDVVFNDANGNGVQDFGESGIGGVQLVLNGPFGLVQTVTTDAGGNYVFNGLAAGTYTVTVNTGTLPANFYSTTRNSPLTIVLADGNTQITDADFGYRLDPFEGLVGSLVWRDDDGNQVQNGLEPGLAGVEIIITWAGRDGVFGTADDQSFNQTTNGAGQYLAAALPIGLYRVNTGAGIPAGFARTTPAVVPLQFEIGDGIGGNPSSQFLSANFGYQPANSSLSGAIFADLNGNGILDVVPNETGRYGGVRVYIDANLNGLFDAGERFAVSSPGGGGNPPLGDWTIDALASGTYRVRIDPATIPFFPPGLDISTEFLDVTVGPSSGVLGVNLGLVQRNAVVNGRVFNDANSNGTQDFGEQGLADVDVTLVWFGQNNIFENGGGDDETYVTTTLADGSYNFSGLPGAFAPGANFRIEVDQTDVPAGATPTVPNPPVVDLTVPIGGLVTQNFGFRVPPTALPGLFYMTLENPGVLANSNGSAATFFDTDIIKLRTDPSGSYEYELYFRGSQFGLTPGSEAIDAMTILNDGSILVSTRASGSVRANYNNGVASGTTISVAGGDLLRLTPTAFSPTGQIVSGTWSLYFRGSRVGLSGTRGNVDAVSALYNSAGQVTSLLLSTAGQVTAKGVPANNFDVLKFNIQALGANTQGTFEMYFRGSNVGLADPTNENVDGLFVQSPPVGLPTLVLTTAGNFSVSDINGVTNGARHDAIQFNPTALGNGTAGTWTPFRIEGSNFGLTHTNIRGLYIGAAPGDPSPLTAAGYRAGGDADLNTRTIRWSEEQGTVNVAIDLSSFSADQVARIRDAIQVVGTAFQNASGMRMVEVADVSQADIRISLKDASTVEAGRLGLASFVYDTALSGFLKDGRAYRTFIGNAGGGLGQVDLIDGWNWYVGADAKGIGRNQYDFQSVVTHELGHLVGLGENRADRTQVMFDTLQAGQVRRNFGKADLRALEALYTERAVLVTAGGTQLDGSTLNNLQGVQPVRTRLPKTDLTQLVREASVAPVSDARLRDRSAVDSLFTGGQPKAEGEETLAGFTRAASLASKMASLLG